MSCNTQYATFSYDSGTVYGAPECIAVDDLIEEILTPAFDLVFIKFSVTYVVNTDYLDPANYRVYADDAELRVRKVLEPKNSLTSDHITLVVDRHNPGTSYTLSVGNITRRDGAVLDPVEKEFISKWSKGDAMLANLPTHFNTDAETSTIRQVLQAIAKSDNLIGGA